MLACLKNTHYHKLNKQDYFSYLQMHDLDKFEQNIYTLPNECLIYTYLHKK